jgi:hypothetical protein
LIVTARRSAQATDEVDLPTAASGAGGTKTHVHAAIHERAADADGDRTSTPCPSHRREMTVCGNWNVDQDELADAPERRVERDDGAGTTVDPETTAAVDDVSAVWHSVVHGRPRSRRLRLRSGPRQTRLRTSPSHGSGLGRIRRERSRPASLDARYFSPHAPVQRRRRHGCGSIPRDGRHSEPRRLTRRKHTNDEGTHEQQPEQTQIAWTRS